MRAATETVWVGGAHVQAADARVDGHALRSWATVLRCAVSLADGGGGLCWLEPMVEAACMHV
jgi:hypothetical protein